MTTLREIFTAFAPEYLERYPNLPTVHRQAISAIQSSPTPVCMSPFLVDMGKLAGTSSECNRLYF